MSVAERLARLRERIALAATRAGRAPEAVRLVGAAKRQPLSRVQEALAAGLEDVGENYVQEAARVRQALGDPASGAIRWHMIGRLQRNKARDAVSLFDCIHSVDRVALAQALDREARRAGRRLDVLLQVNLSGEPQKAGVDVTELDRLVDAALPLEGLRPVGLMTMPAPSEDPEAARAPFARLRALGEALQRRGGEGRFTELSMGMSADLEVAVEEGATMVRIGTALFGARENA